MIQLATPEHAEILSHLQLAVSQDVFSSITGDEYFTSAKFAKRRNIWTDILESDKEKAYLYKIGNHYVGFGSFKSGYHQNPSGAEICSIYVLKEHWRKGIGKKLLMFLTSEIMRDPVISEIFLWTYEENIRTVMFYRNNGFKASGKSVIKNHKAKVIEMVMKINRTV